MYRVRVFIAILFFTSLTACGGGGGGGGGDTSKTNTKTSHNAGQNCLNCHSVGGVAESAAVFNAAGTVYQSNGSVQTNATVNLYISNTNTLSASLKTDGSGNFYTTEHVEGLFYAGGPFVSGVDVEVVGPSGIRRTMSGVITTGACAACHGSSRGNIVVN